MTHGSLGVVAVELTRRLLTHVAATRAASGANGTLAAPLTDREAEVLHYLTEGLSNAEIAAKLVIGHETVKTHVKRICMKAGARDRTQAVVWAYQSGFVTT